MSRGLPGACIFRGLLVALCGASNKWAARPFNAGSQPPLLVLVP